MWSNNDGMDPNWRPSNDATDFEIAFARWYGEFSGTPLLMDAAKWARQHVLDSAEVRGLVEALKYYADEKNWYPVNQRKDAPVLNMVIGSVDTEGNDWTGGRNARLALAAFERAKGGK